MGWFDLHVHTKYSQDSFMDIKRIIYIAKKRSLKGLAITDHNSFRGVQEALRVAHKSKFIIIPGMEIKTEVGDIIGLFLEKEIKSRKYSNVVEEIKHQGGLVVFPHPFSRNSKFSEEFIKDIHLIEIFNSRNKALWNYKAQQVASERGIPYTVGSDAHTYFELGRAKIWLESETTQEIKRELLNTNNSIKCNYANYYLSHGVSLVGQTFKRFFQ